MFDLVHEKKRLVQGILLVVTLPFAVWGVSSYRNAGVNAVASVDGEDISQQEFDQAVQNMQSQMQQRMGDAYDPSMFDRPEIKMAVLRQLVDQRLQTIKAREAGLAPSKTQLVMQISSLFQRNGKFDPELYARWLKSRQMTANMAQKMFSDEIAAMSYAKMYRTNGEASRAETDNIIRASEQQRVIRVAQISPDAFLQKVKVSEADAKQYYDAHQDEFSIPERARVAYVVFSASSAMNLVSVTPQEVQAYYHDHESDFSTPEQRRAAHILIPIPPKADAAAIQKARAQAEAILKQVKRSPGKFAALAKKYSQDPGSAAKGGDLGFFGRGQMVKPFDDAVFSLKPGQISGLVQSQFGFHIIKLLAVHPAKQQPLDQVKSQIIRNLKMEKAGDMFAQMEDKFSDASASQTGSLKNAADLVKSPIQKSGWLEKGHPGDAPWTDKALKMVFSDDVLNKKRNSPAVEVAADTLLVVRLLQHEPPSTRSFADVRVDIMKKLAREKAGVLALKQGQEDLARLQRGESVPLKWGKNETISMQNPREGTDTQLSYQALQADIGKLPAYVGVKNAKGGYWVARIDSIKAAGQIDEAKREGYMQKIRMATGEELLQASLADARKHAKIKTREFAASGKGQ